MSSSTAAGRSHADVSRVATSDSPRRKALASATGGRPARTAIQASWLGSLSGGAIVSLPQVVGSIRWSFHVLPQ